MSALMPAQFGGHAERAAEMVDAITRQCYYDSSRAGLESGHDWVQVAQVHATLAICDAIRDLTGQVAELTEGLAEAREALVDCTPAQPARRPWWRRSAGGAR